MSFLAQLRQTQAPVETGLQLCYLWNLQEQGLGLSLALAKLRDGHMLLPMQPYSVRREHLQMPPPFLNTDDVDFLQTLINADSRWMEGVGQLPSPAFDLLVAATANGRSFLALTPGKWRRLKVGLQASAILPHWWIDHRGWQHTRWRSENGGRLIRVNNEWLYLKDDQIHSTHNPFNDEQLGHWQGQGALSPQQVAHFIESQGALWQALELPQPKSLPVEQLAASLTPVVVCTTVSDADAGERHQLELRLRYANHTVCLERPFQQNPDDMQLWTGDSLLQIRPDREREHALVRQLKGILGLFEETPQRGVWQGSDPQIWRDLLLKQQPQLEGLGFEFVVEPGFRYHYVEPRQWQVAAAAIDSGHWQLSLQFEVAGQPINVLELLREVQLFNQQSAYGLEVRMDDGKILVLPTTLSVGLMEELGDWVEANNARHTLPLSQAYRLQNLHDLLPQTCEWQDQDNLLAQAITLNQSPLLLDKQATGVRAQLRPYQWLGVCWLQHLQSLGVNGLLADDMGLGKTLQTLTHLSLEHRQGALNQPALVVAPTSLLANWASEIDKFCPHLSYVVMHGPGRHNQWQKCADSAVVITSYHCLMNDIERWQQQELSWLILDEAQIIKNPRTQISRALRDISCERKLCLSGTPVANHLEELWSILDFLMPSVLGTRKQFNTRYRKPIEQNGDSQRLAQLLRRVAPLMLRRTKSQVATDLPAKTVIQQTLPLGDTQMALYQELKQNTWQQLQTQLQTEGESQQRFLLLTALLKLRQACCDPQLLGESSIESAKREHCLAMISELTEEGRSVLVFSQFTSMLDILARELEQRNIPFLTLTGRSRNRAQSVEDFQAGKVPVFLISLKAGGVGLNLTRADTVIHYDPWWNVAAENQASDRVHRLGQDKPVFIYKLIAENTIEEKIAKLQQAKSTLSHHIDQQAQASGETFALRLEELLELWHQET